MHDAFSSAVRSPRMDMSSPSDAYRLDDRVAVVTGAASGIGAETCAVLAAAGATVVCGDVNAEGLDATLERIRAVDGTAVGCRHRRDRARRRGAARRHRGGGVRSHRRDVQHRRRHVSRPDRGSRRRHHRPRHRPQPQGCALRHPVRDPRHEAVRSWLDRQRVVGRDRQALRGHRRVRVHQGRGHDADDDRGPRSGRPRHPRATRSRRARRSLRSPRGGSTGPTAPWIRTPTTPSSSSRRSSRRCTCSASRSTRRG